MIVVYAPFELDAEREGFDEWFAPLAERVLAEDGCDTFELLYDRRDPSRAAFFEVWASQAALDAHGPSPAHVQMAEEGTTRWGWRNFTVNIWRDAGERERQAVERLVDYRAQS
jgi:quinol monooxygenase YgiN